MERISEPSGRAESFLQRRTENRERKATNVTTDFGQPRPLVMVVAEEQEVLQQITTALGEAGFGCRCCTTPDAAVAAATENPPDLVVCDLNLGGESGLETCRLIKQQPGLACVPVMYLSGAQLPDVISHSRATGGNYCLRKPLAPKVLVRLIDQALGVPSA